MTTDRTMFDAIDPPQVPADAVAVAGYVDGSWPDYDQLVRMFPHADHLSIAAHPDADADCLDVENFDAQPSDVPAWHARQVARGIARPVIYASVITMSQQILPVLEQAGIGRAQVRLWTAHYGSHLGAHICGPAPSCGLLGIDADGTQYTSNYDSRNLDASRLAPGFFGAPVPPPSGNWTFSAPANLAARGGHTSVLLTWQPPADAPVLPAEYLVWVYRGTKAAASSLVASYPRRAVGVLALETGSLETGKVYTAHVSAAGPNGTRLRAYTYASAIFATA